MMTVKEASRLTGISIRTLQYYDKLGLLPAMRTESGYRLYDDAALERLQQILLFRELEFPLRDIRTNGCNYCHGNFVSIHIRNSLHLFKT